MSNFEWLNGGFESPNPHPEIELEIVMDKNVRGRLLQEHSELALKIQKLQQFVQSEGFAKLPEMDRADLLEQLSHMQKYFSVLDRRVSRACNNA